MFNLSKCSSCLRYIVIMFIFSFDWSEFVLGGSYTVISSEKMLSFHVCSAIERSFINNQRLMKVLNKRYLNYLANKQGHIVI